VRTSLVIRLAVLCCAALLLVSCGNETSSDEQATAVPVEDVLGNASTRLADTESMHFDMRVKGETYIDAEKSIQLVSAIGTMARPDGVDVEFQVRLFGTGTVTIKMITLGDQSWTTNLLTGKWETAPEEFGYNPAMLYDNQNGLGPVMGKIDDPQLAGTEAVNGRDAYHVIGSASSEVMDPLTANTMSGDRIGIELWIDTKTWDLLRVVLTERETPEKSNPATWTMNLTDHDKQVSIEPPR
jgi:outer membrane lipoprotein-sorting protein